jgi:rare lipoprotein A
MVTTLCLIASAFASVAAVAGELRGTATYYGHSGALTAAHRTLPFGSKVRVTNMRNGRSILVRINDRGPEAWTGRTIDLSLGAARALDMIQVGVIPVQLLVER